jgi:predicted XRE-type DNA-binding protein
MIPSFFPQPLVLVYITWVLELLGATGLLLPKFRNQIASQASRSRTRQLARGSEGIADISNQIEVEEGSGNVFADIGLSNPEERLAKADLAIRIGEAIRARRLTQTRAAHILRIDQPKISRLLRGQLSGFSTERLIHFLTLLGRDVEITVKPAPRSRRQGHFRVVATA